METATTHKYVQFRGKPVAIAGSGNVLALLTKHAEGKPTPLYRLNLDTSALSFVPLPKGASCAVSDAESMLIGGGDGQLYRTGLLSGEPAAVGKPFEAPPSALALVADKVAVGVGKGLVIIDAKGKVLQTFELGETVTALAADASGTWIVAGTGNGTVIEIDGEDRSDHVIRDRKKVHESAVSCLLFDPDEPRVYSAGVDQRVFSMHVRGELEPEDRAGGPAHEGAIHSMILGPEDKIYTAGQDGCLRTWQRGAHRKRPSTLKDVGRGVAMARVELKGRPHLALACDDATIRLYAMDAAGKIGERALTVHDAYAWARNEFEQTEVARRDQALRAAAGFDDEGGIELLADRATLDPDHGLKVKATEWLGASGNLRAIARLEALIRAPEEKVRVAALGGLRSLEGQEVLRPLDLALAAKQRDVGVLAVQALQQLAPSKDEAMSRLVRALDDDPIEVRAAALACLEALHPGDSPEASRIALRSKRADIRRLALIRLHQRKLLGNGEVRVALRRHEDDADANVRQAAFLVSVMSQPDLADALRSRDKDLHRLLWELETFGEKVDAEAKPPKVKKAKAELSDDEVRPVLEALASRNLDTCLAGARALASLQDERAFGTLLQLTNEGDASARVEACKAMAELGDPRSMPRLRQMLRDDAREVRDAALTALIRLEESSPLRAAEAALMTPHEDVRSRGLQLLVRTMKKGSKEKASAEEQAEALRLLQKALNDVARAVRGEAFKASLSLDVMGGGADTLRFALRSIHADTRREVLGEVMGRIQESWASVLLLELFADPDPTLRAEAFAFAQKRSKGKSKEPLAAALGGKYEDLKLEAVEALNKKHVAGVRELLADALDDEHEKVRLAAVEGLIVDEAHEELGRAMASEFADVRVRAAAACAMAGDPRSLDVLIAIVAEEEPELAELKGPWSDRVVRALRGLSELGDMKAGAAVARLIDNELAEIRRAATSALGWVCGTDRALREKLVSCLSHEDAVVKREAALGLAFLGDPAGLPLIEGLVKEKGDAAYRGLIAALALGDPAEDLFMSYLDHDDGVIRARALLLMMLVESSEQDGEPDRCLAALSSKHPRTRLVAARALESFADTEKFSAWVTELFNDRGDDRAPWKIPHETVRTIAELLTFGEPGMRVRTARVLETMTEEKSERFERAWRALSNRFERTCKELDDKAKERKPTPPKYAATEMRRVVLGAYAGLSRQGTTQLDARVRQTAIARLAEMAKDDAELIPTVRPLLSMALADRDVVVRKVAFEGLQALGMEAAALASEAISVGLRDMGIAGLKLLSESGKGEEGLSVLERVYRLHTDGLETEAGKLLSESRGWTPVHTMGLEAKSAEVREEAVRGLARAYEKDDVAKGSLRGALKSAFEHVREAAALELGRKKDPAAFDALTAMLRTRRQLEAIEALERLGDDRTPGVLMDRIDHDPAGDANLQRLMEAIGRFRAKGSVERLLGYLEDVKSRRFAFAALQVVSGYDQPIQDGDDEDPAVVVLRWQKRPVPPMDWESKQHPRHDDILAKVLDAAYRLGEVSVLQRLVPAAQWSRGPDVDGVLALLCGSATDAVRDRAVTALGFRVRHRKTKADALVAALSHASLRTQLYAAEALAWAGRSEGVRVLMTAVDMMDDLNDRRRAVRALGELGDATALDVLLRLVNEDGHALQEEAAEAIGHLSRSDKSESIQKLLLQLAKGDGGVALRAMTGLRWFNSAEGWKAIRERARDEAVHVRLHVMDLLAFDPDAAGRDAIVRCIESDDAYQVVRRAAESLRARDGAESLEPDYVLLRSFFGNLEPTVVDRLRERGDPSRILEELPRISPSLRSVYFEPLVAVLLSRDPLPVDAAVSQLTSPHEQVGEVAASIVGRAGKAIGKKHGKALGEAAQHAAGQWEEKRKQMEAARQDMAALAPQTARYRRMIWACGEVDVAPEFIVAAAKLSGDDRSVRVLRFEAMQVLARGGGGKDGVSILREALKDADARIRSLAASGIASQSSSAASAAAADVVDDRASLDRLVSAADGKVEKPLREAAASAHTQGLSLPHLVARGDVKGLVGTLEDGKLPEVTRLGAIEALARIANEAAQKALAAFAKREEEEEELRKAAWRGLRRARRYAASREVTS